MLVAHLANLDPLTLARGESDGVAKLIFFGIILVVWAVGAIASSIKQAAAKRGAAPRLPPANRLTSSPWTSVSPPPIPAAARRPQARRVIPPPPIPRQALAPPPLPLSVPFAEPARSEPAAFAPATARAATPPAPAVRTAPARPTSTASIGAADIRRWLRPEVLRGQYFVTEVFDPPPGALD